MRKLFSNLRCERRHIPRRRERGLLQESQTGSLIASFVLSWRIYAFVEKILSRGMHAGEGYARENCEVSWIPQSSGKKEMETTRYAIFDYRDIARVTGIE